MLVIGVLVGLAPVARLTGLNLAQAFREEGRGGTAGHGARIVRRILVASQVAFAFMLLSGAGLLLTSFQRVVAVDPGFSPANLLTARVAPPASRYAENAAVRTFADRLVTAVRAIPGVQFAGLSSSIPFGGDFSDSVILAEGYQMSPGESLISPYRVVTTPATSKRLGYRSRLAAPSTTATLKRRREWSSWTSASREGSGPA